jgi:vacuolar protein sorting-associated protein 13A/C
MQVNKRSPEFHTKHGSVLKLVDVNFTTLTVLLHQESLLALLEISNSFQSRLEQTRQKPSQDRVVSQPSPTAAPVKVPLSVIPEDEAVVFEQNTARMLCCPLLRG